MKQLRTARCFRHQSNQHLINIHRASSCSCYLNPERATSYNFSWQCPPWREGFRTEEARAHLDWVEWRHVDCVESKKTTTTTPLAMVSEWSTVLHGDLAHWWTGAVAGESAVLSAYLHHRHYFPRNYYGKVLLPPTAPPPSTQTMTQNARAIAIITPY